MPIYVIIKNSKNTSDGLVIHVCFIFIFLYHSLFVVYRCVCEIDFFKFVVGYSSIGMMCSKHKGENRINGLLLVVIWTWTLYQMKFIIWYHQCIIYLLYEIFELKAHNPQVPGSKPGSNRNFKYNFVFIQKTCYKSK
jgi:hypothetical protein